MKEIRTKKGRVFKIPSFDELEAIIRGDEMSGFCIVCGVQADCVEPDADGYDCENCGAPRVYGAEQMVLRGMFYLPTEVPE